MSHPKPRIAVVVFPGSNCEQDVVHALRLADAEPFYAWHGGSDLADAEAVVLPGGFAHGDYLRTGAIARFSPVMDAVARMAEDGRPVVGICNGFQILTEAGLLPGALMRNEHLRFICDWTEVVVDDVATPMTAMCHPGQKLRIPVNHYEGNYRPPGPGGARTVLRYTDSLNGSWNALAGTANERGNVVGMMPHPERACERWLGSTDGHIMFSSLVAWCREAARV